MSKTALATIASGWLCGWTNLVGHRRYVQPIKSNHATNDAGGAPTDDRTAVQTVGVDVEIALSPENLPLALYMATADPVRGT